jgi:hypothetical protein
VDTPIGKLPSFASSHDPESVQFLFVLHSKLSMNAMGLPPFQTECMFVKAISSRQINQTVVEVTPRL